jgi:hypothetical protein
MNADPRARGRLGCPVGSPGRRRGGSRPVGRFVLSMEPRAANPPRSRAGNGRSHRFGRPILGLDPRHRPGAVEVPPQTPQPLLQIGSIPTRL